MTHTASGQDLKDAGCAQVLEHTPEAWVASFEQQAAALLKANGSFKRNGLTGSYEPAKSPTAHGRIITRWSMTTF